MCSLSVSASDRRKLLRCIIAYTTITILGAHPLRLHLSWCILDIIHVLKGWCSWYLLHLKLLILAHLVLNVPQVLILAVVLVHPPALIYHTTAPAKLLRADRTCIHFPNVWSLLICPICLLHAGEVGRTKWTLASITPLPAAI